MVFAIQVDPSVGFFVILKGSIGNSKTQALISREYLLFFSLVGVINGLFLTGYFLWGNQNRRYVNVYLGLLLLALVIRIGKSVFFYFDSGLNEVYIHIGLLGCMAIGPICWYFVRSQISEDKQFDPRSLWHLLPLLGLTVFSIFFVSYDENRRLWSGAIVRGIYVYWGLYTVAALARVVHQRWIRKKRFAEDNWTQGVVVGVFLIWLAYFTSSFTSYLTGSITFTFLMYLLAGVLLHQLRERKPQRARKPTTKGSMSTGEVADIKQRIAIVLNQEGRYKDPELSMPSLAQAIELTPHQFSLFINEQMGQNFSQLVNTHRILAAKELLLHEPHLTVEAIGYDSGFNSASTFYSAFKKETGMTPAAFRKRSVVSTS